MQSAEFEKLLRQQSNSVFFTYLKILIADETLHESNSSQRPFSLFEDIHILLESLAYIEITGKFSSVGVASALSNSNGKLIPSRKHGTARYRMRDFLFQLTESDLANIVVFCRKLRKDKRRKHNQRAGILQGLNDYCLKKSNKIDSPHELFISLTTMDKIKAQYYAIYTLKNMSETEIVTLKAEITDEIQNGQLIIDESMLNETNSNDSDSPRIMRNSSSQRPERQFRRDQQESSNDSRDDAKNKRRNFNSNDNRNKINLHKNNGSMKIGKTIVIDLEGQDKREERHAQNNQRIILSPKQSFQQQANQQQISIKQQSLVSSTNPQYFNGAQRTGSLIGSNQNSPINVINLTSESEEYEENNHQNLELHHEQFQPIESLEEQDIESYYDQVNSGANDELDDGRNLSEMLNQICPVDQSTQKELRESNRGSIEHNVSNTNQQQLQPQLNQEVEEQEEQQNKEEDSKRSVNNNEDDNEDLLSHILKKQQEYLIKLFYANDLAEKQVIMPAQQKQILEQNRDSEGLFDEVEASIENIVSSKKESTESNISVLDKREQQHLQDENHRQYYQQRQMQQHELEKNTYQQQPESQHLEFEELNKQMLSIQLNTLKQEKEEQNDDDQEQKQISQSYHNQNSDLWDRLLSLLRQEYGLSSEELVALLDTLNWDVQLVLNYMQQPHSNLSN